MADAHIVEAFSHQHEIPGPAEQPTHNPAISLMKSHVPSRGHPRHRAVNHVGKKLVQPPKWLPNAVYEDAMATKHIALFAGGVKGSGEGVIFSNPTAEVISPSYSDDWAREGGAVLAGMAEVTGLWAAHKDYVVAVTADGKAATKDGGTWTLEAVADEPLKGVYGAYSPEAHPDLPAAIVAVGHNGGLYFRRLTDAGTLTPWDQIDTAATAGAYLTSVWATFGIHEAFSALGEYSREFTVEAFAVGARLNGSLQQEAAIFHVRVPVRSDSGTEFRLTGKLDANGMPEGEYAGTATFSRSSKAWARRASDGKYVEYEAGELREDCPTPTTCGLLIEPARTNYAIGQILNDGDSVPAGWTNVDGTPALSASGLAADDDTQKVSILQSTTTQGYYYTFPSAIGAVSNIFTWSAFAKTNTAGAVTQEFYTWHESTSQNFAANLTGSVDRIAYSAALAAPIVHHYFETKGTVPAGGLTLELPQLEEGAFPTSPIIAATAGTPRAEDALSFPLEGNINLDHGSLHLEARVPWSVSEPSSNLTLLALGSTTNNIEIYYDAPGDHIKAWVGGTISDSIDLTPTTLALARDSVIVVDLTWRSAASAPPNGIIKGAAYVQGTPAPVFVPPGSFAPPSASGAIHVGGHSTASPVREAAAAILKLTISEDVIP